MSLKSFMLALTATIVLQQAASAAVVNSFLPVAGPPAPGAWYLADVINGGTASVVSLAGSGGNLENNQPLPVGAAQLTTVNTNASKAEVYTYSNFGSAAAFLTTAQLGYDYYKANSGAISPDVAPAMKLLITGPGTGDNFGALVYEPYWNGAVTPDTWTNVSINSTTGAGGDSTGGWWWNGGYEIGSGSGGPPLRSLTEWAAALTLADPDFASASVVGIGMGIGSFNPAQVNYFDNVTFSSALGSGMFDFEPIPEPATLGLAGLAAMGLAIARRRRNAA